MFTKAQWRILLGCFIAYAAAYIGRLNLSQALPDLARSLHLTGAQAGLLQTAFAVVYAAGQLVNGAIVDRISVRRHILIGLIATAALNLLCGAARAYWMLLVLWTLNGAAQSMLWTPIVKLIARWYDGEARNRVSFVMSITLVAGHLLAWAISGYMALLFGWRLSFVIPGAAIVLLAPLALALLKDRPEADARIAYPDGRVGEGAMPVGAMIFRTGLWAMLLCCVANGFVRDGVMTWGPSMISGAASSAMSGAIGVSLIIPLLNLLGILFGKLCFSRFQNRSRVVVGAMMGLGAASAMLLRLAGAGGVALAALLGLSCALMYGVNPILTTLVPMEYAPVKRVALAAGLIDCFIYLGSSLAGVATGAFIEAAGPGGAYLSWIAACLAGLGLALLSARGAIRPAK